MSLLVLICLVLLKKEKKMIKKKSIYVNVKKIIKKEINKK